MTRLYKDKWVKIIGSLIASLTADSMGRVDSIFQRLSTWSFFVDLFAGFVIAIILWEGIKRITVWLDRKHSWFEKPLERFLLQFIFGVATPVFLSFLMVLVYMKEAWNQDIFRTEWLYNEFYLVIFIILIINFIYFSWWVYLGYLEKSITTHPVQDSTILNNNPKDEKESLIRVTKGGKSILLSPSEIAHIQFIEGYTYVQKSDGEDYVSTLSLEYFYKVLDRDRFFRVNRQIIVQKKSCTAYQTIENGKIEIEVSPKILKRVIVSQKRAKEFRKWISNP